jgi:hypothetical protein
VANVYSVNVVSQCAPNTDNTVVEIEASGVKVVKIKKIRIMHGEGDETVTADYHREIIIGKQGAAGTGSSAYTALKLDQNAPAATSTIRIGAFTGAGDHELTNVISAHSSVDFFWQAADEDDKIVIRPGGIFKLIINPAQ